jgi:hypothetical protein
MLESLCERPRRQEVTGERARDIAREQKVEDIIREPVELIDQDLDEVAGGSQTFNFDIDFNNFDSNQGVQIGAIVQSDVYF